MIEVGGKALEGIGRTLDALIVTIGLLWSWFGLPAMVVYLRRAVSDVVDHVDAGNILLAQQKHRLAFLLAEDGDQHVSAGHLALARGLHMKDRRSEERRVGKECRARWPPQQKKKQDVRAE